MVYGKRRYFSPSLISCWNSMYIVYPFVHICKLVMIVVHRVLQHKRSFYFPWLITFCPNWPILVWIWTAHYLHAYNQLSCCRCTGATDRVTRSGNQQLSTYLKSTLLAFWMEMAPLETGRLHVSPASKFKQGSRQMTHTETSANQPADSNVSKWDAGPKKMVNAFPLRWAELSSFPPIPHRKWGTPRGRARFTTDCGKDQLIWKFSITCSQHKNVREANLKWFW